MDHYLHRLLTFIASFQRAVIHTNNSTEKIGKYIRVNCLALLLFLCSFVAYSQTTILTENFDAGGLPAGWSRSGASDCPGGYNVWYNTSELTSTGSNWCGTLCTSGRGGAGRCMFFYDWHVTTVANDLITPANDLSGYTSSTLTFYYYNSSETDVFNVYANQGVGAYSLVGGPYAAAGAAWTLVTINMNAWTGAGNNQVHIKIIGTGICGSTNIGFDDLLLTATNSGCTAPTTQATSFTSGSITNTTMTIGWTRGNGNNVLVVAKAGSAPTDPSSGTSYTGNAAYGSGTSVGGGYAVYNGAGTSVNLTSLTAGTTYYFAIYEYATTGTCYNLTELTGNATTTGASGPANDDCAGAIALTVNSSCSYTAGTSASATQSLAGCSGSADDDVWYKFVAIAATATITVAPSVTYDAAFELRSGACNGTQIAGSCTDGPGNGGTETYSASGLTVASTYYIRVWNYNAGSGSSTFNICVASSACGVGITFQPNSACAVVAGSATFAVTASGSPTYQWQVNTGSGFNNISAAGSNPTYAGYTSSSLVLTGIVAGNNNYQYQCVCTNGCSVTTTNVSLFVSGAAAPVANAGTGASTSGFTANWNAAAGALGYYLDVAYDNAFTVMVLPGYYNLDVGNVLSKAVTGLACGTTYYYRVRAYNACGPSSNSSVITKATTACTNNDDCAGAINLTVGNGSSCNSPWYTTLFATASTQTVCTGNPDDDVWFTFTAPTATVTVDVGASYNFDAAFDVMSGTCAGGLTSIGCQDAHALYGSETKTYSTLTPGTVYYVRVYNWRVGAGSGAFTICISNPWSFPLSPTNNDAAASAIALTNHDCFPRNAANWAFFNTTGATNSAEPGLPAAWTASTTVNKTTWYKFTATTTAQMITTAWDHTNAASAVDNRIAVYTAGMSLLGSNEDLEYINGAGTGKGGDFEHWYYGTTNTFSGVTVTGLTVGNVYYIRVDSPDGILAIGTEPAPSNDGCSTAFNMGLNVDYLVNNTGAGLFTNNNTVDAAFNCTGNESTENLMYYTFTPTITDVYYINQWSQYCDIGWGTQFIVYDPTYNCANIPDLVAGANVAAQILCDPSSLANRSYSVSLTASSTYYIIIDGGQGDECLFHFEISRGSAIPLPVELLSFNAVCEEGKIKADWTTATELNNDYFVLEHSADGVQFTEGKRTKGAGTSNIQNHYKVVESESDDSKYYRLKQVDYNGEYAFSKTLFASCKNKPKSLDVTAIVPVPSDNYVDIYYTIDKEDHVAFELYDMLGKKVVSENELAHAGGNIHQIDLASLNSGVYYLIVKSSTDVVSNKLIKR